MPLGQFWEFDEQFWHSSSFKRPTGRYQGIKHLIKENFDFLRLIQNQMIVKK